MVNTVLFFVTAHSAPAKATRPLLESTQAFHDLAKAKTFDLDQVLKARKSGLADEPKERQSALRAQAKQFTSFKTAEQFYQAICSSEESSTNVMCVLEKDRRKVRDVSADQLSSQVSSLETVNESHVDAGLIREANVETLSKHSFASLNKAFSAIDTPSEISKIVDQLIAYKTCTSSALYLAAANKTEEFFPDADQVKKAKSLYEKAADCSSDELGMKARYRFSLLQIWQNSCDKVDSYLAAVEESPAASAYQSRARYWRHQCAVKTNTQQVRVATEQALLKNNLMSFHSLVVNGESEQFSEMVNRKEPTKVLFRSVVRPDLNLRVQGIEALLANGSEGWAGEYLDKLSVQLAGAEPEFRLYTATLADRANNMIAKFKILSNLFDDSPRMVQASTLKMYFPLSYFQQVQTRAKDVDPYLILSLIRQESAFNRHARSPVGARGLMQVMPATARSIAAVSSRRLFDPKTNIQVGTKYFLNRLNQFNGDVGLTLAAYNAGSTRVDRWVKRYAGADKMLFMDLIPYRETRDYVASILRNHYWYTRLYEKKSASAKDFSAHRS